MAKKRVLFIVGSLRRGSFNRELAQLAARGIEDRAEVAFLDYADVPFFNQDIEFPPPESVVRVRAEVAAADALWVVSPEYNYNVPAQLKNLLDWLSRPLVAGDYATPLAPAGKPAAISGAGGKRCVSGGRAAVRALLEKMGAKPVGGDGEGFALPPEAWTTGMYAVPAADAARLAAQGESLLAAL